MLFIFFCVKSGMERSYIKGSPADFVLYSLVFEKIRGKKATVHIRCNYLLDCLFS